MAHKNQEDRDTILDAMDDVVRALRTLVKATCEESTNAHMGARDRSAILGWASGALVVAEVLLEQVRKIYAN